jgi:hypothetical protein
MSELYLDMSLLRFSVSKNIDDPVYFPLAIINPQDLNYIKK